jgi:ornithine cyclodeaminase
MEECIDVMAEVLASLSRGEAIQPLRTIVWTPEGRGGLGLMPGYLAGTEGGPAGVLGTKIVTVFPGNHGTELDSHQGVVLLFEAERGRLLAIVDATSVTAIRTAAVSGVATRLLAREGAADLAILGSGTQAGTHLEAMRAVRPIRRIRVWSRSFENAGAFARRESKALGITVEPAGTVQEAVEGASIICTTTSAREPVLEGRWISPGAHVNAVGSSIASARELDTAAVVGSRLFVDRRESTVNEAGDFLFPKKEGAIGDDHIVGEIGGILAGKIGGRRSESEITLFKSLGLAVEDVAAASYIYTRANRAGPGKGIDIGGKRRHD